MLRTILALALLSSLTLACEATLPPPSSPPPTAPINAAMRGLADDLGTLEATLAVAALGDSDRDRALGILESLAERAEALQKSPAGAKHPMLSTGLPALRAAVDDARVGLKRAPPDPAPAKELARSCRACHAVASLSPTPPTPPSTTTPSAVVMGVRFASR